MSKRGCRSQFESGRTVTGGKHDLLLFTSVSDEWYISDTYADAYEVNTVLIKLIQIVHDVIYVFLFTSYLSALLHPCFIFFTCFLVKGKNQPFAQIRIYLILNDEPYIWEQSI